jgi:uncharacterized protein YcfJ
MAAAAHHRQPESKLKSASIFAVAIAGLVMTAHAGAEVTVFERAGFEGRSVVAEGEVRNLERYGFNDRAASVIVAGDRSDRWEVCDDRGFRGRCVVLRPGEYASPAAMGLNGRVGSLRVVDRDERVDDRRYAPAPPVAQRDPITFYTDEDYRGRSYTLNAAVEDFRVAGFNDRASSLVVRRGSWEICEAVRFAGRCVVLRRGEYRSLAAMGLNDQVSSAREVGRGARAEDARDAPVPPPAPAPTGQIDLYENEGFQGRSLSANAPMPDLRGNGFNDRASSAVVTGDRWEVCENTGFGGRCLVLRQGQYPSLAAMGLNDRISSVRAVPAGARVDEGRYSPLPLVARDYRRRESERLYEADVIAVRAVLEDSGQHCWVEAHEASPERGDANVPGAVLGAVIGGILGHQVGGGTGRDVATGLGAVAGAAIGANTGRGEAPQQAVPTQNVQRCSQAPGQAHPAYWDVTYRFRGQEYRVQLTRPPGPTVTVNEQGEPRA